jgi:predicted DNA-binding transcriptional regulator AlpA
MNSEITTILDTLSVLTNQKMLLTKTELSKILGVSRTTIDNYMKRDDNPLSFIKFGKSVKSPVRFHLKSVALFLFNNKENSDV